MSTAQEIIDELKGMGFIVGLYGNKLSILGQGNLSLEFIKTIRKNEPAIVALLRERMLQGNKQPHMSKLEFR